MWIAKATGDMTLSILDENNTQIIKVDMLKANTMKAGTNGALLTQTLNSLFVISQFPEGRIIDVVLSELPYPDDNILPLPWSYTYQPEKRVLRVKHAKGILCEREYPHSFGDD